uniref:Dynein light chain 1, cytoplasmic n=1 Tax=Macrostomum lignano TaxID=282301 RepID=A0A1I8H525_9PLAT
MASQTLLEVTRTGRCFLVGLNRPEKRNCVNSELARLLYSAFKQFEKDSESSVLVLHGRGGNFCSGFDLAEAAKFDEASLAPMGPSRLRLSKPSVAAISGYAVAGGLELALLCDLRVVEASATLGVFCRRFGVPLIDGGTVRLPALIGLSRALDLILTGRPVGAREAAEMGLANRVCPDGQALQTAVALAEEIASFPQACARADRASAVAAAYFNCGSSTNDRNNADGLLSRLAAEFTGGERVLAEAATGAAGFVRDGRGRGGRAEQPKLLRTEAKLLALTPTGTANRRRPLRLTAEAKLPSSVGINLETTRQLHRMSERKAVIKNADISTSRKDIAAYIKKEFDKKYNPTWHCIVGRNFGSYVTHETKHFIYFYLGQVAILLFKSG